MFELRYVKLDYTKQIYLLHIFRDLRICITNVLLQLFVLSSLLAVGVIQDNTQHHHPF
jgi:hypothetical protein